MLGIDIGVTPLAEQIKRLAGADQIIGAEFRRAAHLHSTAVVKDLQGGVATISGELRYGISGDVNPLQGVEVDTTFTAGAQSERGYNYGARLDKDGRMVWRGGKYRGRRTFGWFSYAGPRVARKLAKKLYQAALDEAVKKLGVKA